MLHTLNLYLHAHQFFIIVCLFIALAFFVFELYGQRKTLNAIESEQDEDIKEFGAVAHMDHVEDVTETTVRLQDRIVKLETDQKILVKNNNHLEGIFRSYDNSIVIVTCMILFFAIALGACIYFMDDDIEMLKKEIL